MNLLLLTLLNSVSADADCSKFVSKNPDILNSDCQKQCTVTDDCMAAPAECYGNWMYGYSEEYGVLNDYDQRWENDFHWTEHMEEGSTAQQCQERCQLDYGCGFFGFRSKATYGGIEGPVCVMKQRDSVIKAIHKAIPLSLWGNVPSTDSAWDFCNLNLAYNCNTAGQYDCKTCEGNSVCAWQSYWHVSGPKFCGTDSWMEDDEACSETVTTTTTSSEPVVTTGPGDLIKTLPPHTEVTTGPGDLIKTLPPHTEVTTGPGDLIKTLPPHTEEPFPFPTQVPCWGQYDKMDLDFVHIQDFTGSYIKRREDIHADLTDIFDTLKDSFKSTKFTIVGANDKTHELSPDPEDEFECNDMLGESMDYNSSDYNHAMDEILKKSHYKYNYARPNIFDPLVDILNRWALEDATYDSAVVNKTIRMVSIATDQCSRVSGHYEKISSAIYEPWTNGERNIEFPLTGDVIATCQERDFPSVLEIAQELELRKVKIVVAVNPEMNDDGSVRTCQGYELFPHDVVSNLPVTEWWSKHVQEVFDDELVESYINTDSRLDGSMVPPILNGMIGILCPPYHSSTETV